MVSKERKEVLLLHGLNVAERRDDELVERTPQVRLLPITTSGTLVPIFDETHHVSFRSPTTHASPFALLDIW